MSLGPLIDLLAATASFITALTAAAQAAMSVARAFSRERPPSRPLTGANRERVMNGDEHSMRRALKVATDRGDDASLSPIGGIIVLNGEVIARERDPVEEDHDAIAHATSPCRRGALGEMDPRRT